MGSSALSLIPVIFILFVYKLFMPNLPSTKKKADSKICYFIQDCIKIAPKKYKNSPKKFKNTTAVNLWKKSREFIFPGKKSQVLNFERQEFPKFFFPGYQFPGKKISGNPESRNINPGIKRSGFGISRNFFPGKSISRTRNQNPGKLILLPEIFLSRN